MIRSIIWAVILALSAAGALMCPVMHLVQHAQGRDDGRYANSPLKQWFDTLYSAKGFCCSQADGRETEYDIRGDKYWVPVNGTWTEVPDDAVITEPNKFGRPMLWLRADHEILCFIPGTGS